MAGAEAEDDELPLSVLGQRPAETGSGRRRAASKGSAPAVFLRACTGGVEENMVLPPEQHRSAPWIHSASTV